MKRLEKDDIAGIAKELTAGGVVGLPTETVYGLAARLDSTTALEKLIYLKRREIGSGKIFTLVPENRRDIEKYAMMTKFTKGLAWRYLPGELTLVLHKNPAFRHPYFDHFKSVGIRIPYSPLFRDLVKETGALFLTSANPRGGVPAKDADELAQIMPDLDAVVEGESGGGVPSTILDCTVNPARILRQGALEIQIPGVV